jgi:hypothetical protein
MSEAPSHSGGHSICLVNKSGKKLSVLFAEKAAISKFFKSALDGASQDLMVKPGHQASDSYAIYAFHSCHANHFAAG